ncbi:hypothetical protein K438DRAFT_1978584 [Mycena galopus ATCC 62051]|nr:hypothetical protein K438DRAFT_1978584 [Mycena galopus ATCC 62051]
MLLSVQDQGPGLEPKKRVCRHLSKADKKSGTPAVNDFTDKDEFPTDVADAAHAMHTDLLIHPGKIRTAVRWPCDVHLILYSPRRDMHSGTVAAQLRIGPHNKRPIVSTPAKYTRRYGDCAIVYKSAQYALEFLFTCEICKAAGRCTIALFLVDHCYPFGARGASSNSEQICRALLNIWHGETKQDASALGYEDDLASLRHLNTAGPFMDGAFKYRLDRDTAFALISKLDTP